MIIRTPSRVSPQTFVNFVYLYVNKQFTAQIMLRVAPQHGASVLKVAPNVGHAVKRVY
jgi:hypothetical protein